MDPLGIMHISHLRFIGQSSPVLCIFQGTPVSIKTGDTKTVGVPNHGKDKSIHDLAQLQNEKKLRMCIAFRVLKVQSGKH